MFGRKLQHGLVGEGSLLKTKGAAKRLFQLTLAFSLALILALLASCRSTPEPSPLTTPLNVAPKEPVYSLVLKEPAGQPERDLSKRLIVRTGDISLVVEDVASAQQEIARLAEELGGFVVSSRQMREGIATISIRVPEAKFEEAVRRLRGLATRVEEENLHSQDVTEEYVDLTSRLRNLEATEKQLLGLMEKATKVEEVLLVFKELSSVRQEIEITRGRMQYLERTAALSFITVTLQPVASTHPLIKPGWSWQEVVRDALRSFISVGQGLANAALWSVIFIPLWLPALLILYFVGRWLPKKLRRAKLS